MQKGHVQSFVRKSIWQNGFSTAPQPVHRIGSYGSAGGIPSIRFSGVYRQPSGTTMRVASMRVDGHTFQLKRTPFCSSCAAMSTTCCCIVAKPSNATPGYTFRERRRPWAFWSARAVPDPRRVGAVQSSFFTPRPGSDSPWNPNRPGGEDHGLTTGAAFSLLVRWRHPRAAIGPDCHSVPFIGKNRNGLNGAGPGVRARGPGPMR